MHDESSLTKHDGNDANDDESSVTMHDGNDANDDDDDIIIQCKYAVVMLRSTASSSLIKAL